MSVWQFMAAIDGYVEANSSDDGSLGGREADELWEWMQMKDVPKHSFVAVKPDFQPWDASIETLLGIESEQSLIE